MVFVKHACGAPVALYSFSPFGDRMPYTGIAPYGGEHPSAARPGRGGEQRGGTAARSQVQVALLQVNDKKGQAGEGA